MIDDADRREQDFRAAMDLHPHLEDDLASDWSESETADWLLDRLARALPCVVAFLAGGMLAALWGMMR